MPKLSIFGQFKSKCRKPPKKEKAFLVKGGDDQPEMLMVELCELMKDEQIEECPKHMLVPKEVQEEKIQRKLTEYVTLVEDKVHLQQKEKVESGANVWYLDSGASNHMAGNIDQFSKLNTSVGGTVKFGDASTVQICGRGTVLFETRKGEHKVLTDVYFIPRLKSSIISLGQLEERGCKVVIEDGMRLVFDHQRALLARVKRSRNGLYILNLDRADCKNMRCPHVWF